VRREPEVMYVYIMAVNAPFRVLYAEFSALLYQYESEYTWG